MAPWKKYFKSANSQGLLSPLSRRGGRTSGEDAVGFLNYPNLLPESYMGCPNRIERYQNFESMDQDSEINAALDILAEFSTQSSDKTDMCFELNFKETPTETEAKIIKERLQTWYYLNEFHKRTFKMFRSVLKYGDQVFLRDPETFKLFYVEMDNVIKVIVNESKGKLPEQYILRNIMPNFQNLTATQVMSQNLYDVIPSGPGFTSSTAGGSNMPSTPYSSQSRFTHGQNEHAIDAQHVLHLSLTEGLDPNWPFGTSILEMVFKVFKQKELLEDSIVIYRVQRAPERRVFKIDVGDMPSHMAMAFIDKVKNEIYQRRIPSFGENQRFMDSTYASLAPNADFFFPVTAGGRGSTVDQLPGGEHLNDINDLLYFNNKMVRALRIPSSYLPTGPDDSERVLSDGKVGNALIQEFRFNQYCQRLQRLIMSPLDLEFKAYLKWCGVNIDSSTFTLGFNPPQNFAHYRQAELDQTKIGTFTQLEGYSYFSKRWLMQRYLGVSPEEMIENDKLWCEEHSDDASNEHESNSFRNIGVTPGSIQTDMDMFGSPEGVEGMEGEPGAEGVPGAEAPAAGAQGQPAAPPLAPPQ